MPTPFVTDLALAKRLERTEAHANAAFVEARARVQPTTGAAWHDFGGTYAMFDGVASPITQTFGLGLFTPPSPDQLDAIEAFFRDRGAEVFHEVSPLADPEVLSILSERDYHPIELTTVMHLRLTPERRETATRAAPSLTVRRIGPGEEEMWAETMARGWGEMPEFSAFMQDFGRISAESKECFIAEWSGAPIAAAAAALHEGVALLAGASTDPAFRGRGAQAALLDIRLGHAVAAGCDLAMMGALPGSSSQRNGERQGFRIAYTRIKWQQRRPSHSERSEESQTSR